MLRYTLPFILFGCFLSMRIDATAQIVQLRSEVTDTSGNPIDSIERGGEFMFRMHVQDIRPEATGVFAAFTDVTYDPKMFATIGEIDHGGTYAAAPSGTLRPGELDEVGGVDGISPLGGDEYFLFSVPMVSLGATGVGTFTPNPAEDQVQHPIIVFGTESNLNLADVLYLPVSLTVVPEPNGIKGLWLAITALAIRSRNRR